MTQGSGQAVKGCQRGVPSGVYGYGVSMRSGAPLEADAYHERILALAEQHGLAAPVNRRVLEKLREAARAGLGPECCSASDLLPAQGAPAQR